MLTVVMLVDSTGMLMVMLTLKLTVVMLVDLTGMLMEMLTLVDLAWMFRILILMVMACLQKESQALR